MKKIGEISKIFRYPVKSFEGESLQKILVTLYGLEGDRYFAIKDADSQGLLSQSEIPELINFKASFQSDHSEEVVIKDRKGNHFNWGTPSLKKVIERFYQQPIEFGSLESVQKEAGLYNDVAPILIITTKKLNTLKALWGEEVNLLRFRANFLVELEDDVEEETLLASDITIGDVVLQPLEECERCNMITIDPVTGVKTPALHKAVAKEFNNRFGIYYSVKTPGNIAVNTSLYI